MRGSTAPCQTGQPPSAVNYLEPPRVKPFTGTHSARESAIEMIRRRKAQPLGGFCTTNAKHFLVHKALTGSTGGDGGVQKLVN